ncbi:S8 family serine peptidase [Micromonospora sp. WMMD882]|uniref:S8 family serine peptidase n=1 Tax=Micromonospora sp. WMMD882 TaxID=3015151 RepID=UPI00248B2BDE|nr:S8 family serine peptidase [Micromonospora sp. WMMD882]WBB78956.1 S8 family serine peptidase [Micromonospora sp. WMMD882]
MQPAPLPGPFAPPPTPAPPSALPVVAAVLAGCWTVGVVLLPQVVGWLVEQVMLATGLDRPVWLWPAVSLLTIVMVGVPALLLALVPRSDAVRAVGRAWLAGVSALGALGLLRMIPAVHHEAYLAGLAVVAVLAAVVIARLRRRAARPDPADAQTGGHGQTGGHAQTGGHGQTGAHAQTGGHGRGAGAPVTLLAVAAGLLLLLPWLWLGALGGLLETALAVLAATAVGVLAGALLDAELWARFGAGPDRRPARLVLVGGLVAGVTLLLLAAGVGHSGSQLALLLTLPPAGFVLAALQATPAGPSGPAPVRWLVGLTVLGPLAGADPEEVTLLLTTTRDVPFWVAVAAGAAFAVALLVALGYGLLLPRRAPGRPVAAVTVGVLLVAAAGVYAGPGQPGLSGERLLVVLREQADLRDVPRATGAAGRDARVRAVYRRLVDTADRSQADLRRQLARLRLPYTAYYLVNAIEVDGGPAVRAWLSSRPEVDRVLVSQRLRPLPAPVGVSRGDATAPTGPEWNIRMIGADRVWSELGVDGAGITVGSSDSGADAGHPALAAGFRGGDDSWYDPWDGSRSPRDTGGHGTHTVGSAVGRGGIGVAPGATWTSCVNLDRNLGSPARYLDCLQFMLAPFPPGGDPFTDGRPERAPQVLTNSWGCPVIEGCDPAALRPATVAFEAAGVFVVAAAGNTGPYCGSIDDPPATHPDVLTVGAVDRSRRVTDFSSRGPGQDGGKPDVVAPGAAVRSAMPGGGYAVLDGTSMATPQVAGVVALMWSASPALVGDLERTRRLLRDTATPVEPPPGAAGRPDRCGATADAGAGLVDAYAAVRAARR